MTRSYARRRPGSYDTRHDTLVDAMRRKGKKAFQEIRHIIRDYEAWMSRMPASAKERLMSDYMLRRDVDIAMNPFTETSSNWHDSIGNQRNLSEVIDLTEDEFDTSLKNLQVGQIRQTQVMADMVPMSMETYDPATKGMGPEAWKYFE